MCKVICFISYIAYPKVTTYVVFNYESFSYIKTLFNYLTPATNTFNLLDIQSSVLGNVYKKIVLYLKYISSYVSSFFNELVTLTFPILLMLFLNSCCFLLFFSLLRVKCLHLIDSMRTAVYLQAI